MKLFRKAAVVAGLAAGAMFFFAPAAQAGQKAATAPCYQAAASQSGTNVGLLNGLQVNGTSVNVSDVLNGAALGLLGVASSSATHTVC